MKLNYHYCIQLFLLRILFFSTFTLISSQSTNVLEVEYAQVFFGENLKNLEDGEIISFQESIEAIAIIGNSAKASCVVTEQRRTLARNQRPRPGPNKRRRERIPPSNRRRRSLLLNKVASPNNVLNGFPAKDETNAIKGDNYNDGNNKITSQRNLQSLCNDISIQSMTINYQVTWETASENQNLDVIRLNFEDKMKSAEIKDGIKNDLFRSIINMCVNSVRDPIRIDNRPTFAPTSSMEPSLSTHPTAKPSMSSKPSFKPTASPSMKPSFMPSNIPSTKPSHSPSSVPSSMPSHEPSVRPSSTPSALPSSKPSVKPSDTPSAQPSFEPSTAPSTSPTAKPSVQPSDTPSVQPTFEPSTAPSTSPSAKPLAEPSN